MAISRSLSCRRHIAVLLLLLMLPPLLVCGSRISAKERLPRRTAEESDSIPVPACSSCKTNSYTVGSDGNVTSTSSSSSSGSGIDDSDRLIPTGPNPLHHRHH